MLKFLVSAIAVTSTASALVRPQPEFTLRDPRQMARHDHLPMLDVHDGARLPGDPKPKRPPAPPPPAVQQKPAPDVMQKPSPGVMKKPAPLLLRDRPTLVPGDFSHPGMIRGLHSHDDHHHDDHHHDDHHTDDHHHDDHRMSPPVRGAKPPPAQIDDDWIFPYHNVKPSAKPTPSFSAGGMKPKPKPKPKSAPMLKLESKPKPKPAPPSRHSLASSSRVDNAYAGVQQQCEMDYARMCQPFQSLPGGHNDILGIPIPMMSPQRPLDTFVVDFFIMEESTETAPRSSSGTRKITASRSGDDDADDYTDDDFADDDVADDDDFSDDDYMKSDGPFSDFFDILMGGARPRARLLGEQPRRILWARDHVNDEPELLLGYGREGDMCLRKNMPRLSRSCQSSLAELEEAADAFDVEDEDGCHMLPIVVMLLLVGLAVRFAARRRMKKRLDSLQTTLTAIHASPELKAKVEAASGVPLPPTLPACRMAQKPWYVKAMCVLGAFAVSFIVVANAFLITGLIVSQIYADSDSDDDSYGVSALLVLAILFTVLTLEIIVVRKMKSAICAYLDSKSDSAVTASSGTSQGGSNGNGNGNGASLPQIFQRIRSVQLSALVPARFRQNSAGEGPQYEPLLSEDNYQDECTEMSAVPTRVTASAPPAAVSTIPVVITPVSYASPRVQGSISML
mmetsp:Transcript_32089/g.59702  ORF Transcript_32089/g.59702 Transcript_32089/m.59702 type:complete len:679 (-) Transcript_32089:185-2221(-)